MITKNNLNSRFFTKINELIENALFDLYAVICNYIPDIYYKISSLAENFYAFFHKKTEYLLAFILYFKSVFAP